MSWRVGKTVPLNVYEGDRPVCQCHAAEDAERIVQAMNADQQDLPAIPAGEYQGLKLGAALDVYFRRQDRRGYNIHIYRVLRDLTRAGAYLTKQRSGRSLFQSQVQALRIAFSEKRKRKQLEWDEQAQAVRLAESALAPPKMRKR
jgi:hypothetical protein